jgi:hypothetical protein
MVYNIQNQWGFRLLFPSSGILENRKYDVSETGSVPILRFRSDASTLQAFFGRSEEGGLRCGP